MSVTSIKWAGHAKPAEQPAVDPGGGGGDNGGMESRVAKLEAVAEHMQRDLSDIKSIVRGHDAKFDSMRDRQERDFRILFGAIIAVALGLAALMAKGFHWI